MRFFRCGVANSGGGGPLVLERKGRRARGAGWCWGVVGRVLFALVCLKLFSVAVNEGSLVHGGDMGFGGKEGGQSERRRAIRNSEKKKAKVTTHEHNAKKTPRSRTGKKATTQTTNPT